MNAATTRRWLIPALILLAAAGLFAFYNSRRLISLRSAIAQGIGFERDDYKVYPTATAPQDFYGRVYTRTRITPVKQDSAASPADASAKVGFPVVVPEDAGMEPVDTFIISSAHSLQVYVDMDEARRILLDSGFPEGDGAEIAQDFQVKFDIPAGVVIYQDQGERWYFLGGVIYQDQGKRWYTLIQSLPVAVQDLDEDGSAKLASLLELNLRSLGLSAEDAQRFASEFGWADFFAVPPTELALAELISVSGSPALLLSKHAYDPSLHAIIWKADGILYGLYGSLPPEELLQMAESLGGG